MLLSLLPAYLQALEERLGCLVRGFKAQRGGKPFQGHSSQLSGVGLPAWSGQDRSVRAVGTAVATVVNHIKELTGANAV